MYQRNNRNLRAFAKLDELGCQFHSLMVHGVQEKLGDLLMVESIRRDLSFKSKTPKGYTLSVIEN